MGKKLVVFGGEHEFNKVEKNRVCLHDVKILILTFNLNLIINRKSKCG